MWLEVDGLKTGQRACLGVLWRSLSQIIPYHKS